MKGYNDLGHEESRRPSIWDGSVQDKREQQRQEEAFSRKEPTVTVKENREKQYEAADGTFLLSVDIVSGQLYVPDSFINKEHVAEFAEAIQAARQELEGAAQ